MTEVVETMRLFQVEDYVDDFIKEKKINPQAKRQIMQIIIEKYPREIKTPNYLFLQTEIDKILSRLQPV